MTRPGLTGLPLPSALTAALLYPCGGGLREAGQLSVSLPVGVRLGDSVTVPHSSRRTYTLRASPLRRHWPMCLPSHCAVFAALCPGRSRRQREAGQRNTRHTQTEKANARAASIAQTGNSSDDTRALNCPQQPKKLRVVAQ
jgi:hypothetical protein